jgi:type IX secretion system PorP/SprF family membrane protein
MKNLLTGAFALLLVIIATSDMNGQAQRYFDERYISTHSFLNPVLINPGATAFHNGQQLMVNYRNKWSTFDDSPKTITLGYDGVLMDRLGVGVIFLQDNFGSLKTSKGQLSLSYGISSADNKISFGLATEYIQHGLNSVGSSNENFDFNDPLYKLKSEGASFLDVSFGMYGKYQERFTYGIALPSLISSRLDDGGDNPRDLGFIVNLGYQIQSETGISIEPSIVVKKLNRVPTHIDLNAKLGFLEDKFTSGVSYTIGADKRLGFLIGFAIDKLNFYYTYNTSMQEFQDYNNGSHEITAKLTLGSTKKDMVPTEDGMK